jgi:perosamine synthetase
MVYGTNINMAMSIPVNTPVLDGNEEKYLAECIRTGWISSEGPAIKDFEQKFAAKIGRKFGIAVSNGTAALEMAVKALNLGPGDEVILPTFTIISCAAAVVKEGAVPVVVDADSKTWNMDISRLEEFITPQTKAIMPVHIYGLPVDMDPVIELARKNNLKIIEDAAEAHRGKPCGTFGDLSIFSFYPNKLITTGEGGMILTDDAELAERCRSLRNLCFQPQRRFVHEELGWNYRMTNLQAALGLAQLEQWDTFIKRKRSMGRLYTQLLNGIEGVQLPPEKTDYTQNLYWVYGLVLDEKYGTAETVMRRLSEISIGTRPFFWPMHQQPVFNTMGLFTHQSCPVAEKIAQQGFYLPSGLGLTEEQIVYVADSLKKVLR